MTDAFNHRVKKFDSNGAFLAAWGSQGTTTASSTSRTGSRWTRASASSCRTTTPRAALLHHGLVRLHDGLVRLRRRPIQVPDRHWLRLRTGSMSPTRAMTGSSASRPHSVIVVRKTRSPTTRRTSTSRPAAVSAPPRSSSTTTGTTPTICRTRDLLRRSRLRLFGLRGPSRPDGTSARRRARTALRRATSSVGWRRRDLHVHEPKRAQIFVVQDTLPDDPQDFDFTAGGGLSPTSFQLDDDGDNSNALSNTQHFDNVVPGSGYSVSQTTPAGLEPGRGHLLRRICIPATSTSRRRRSSPARSPT